MKTPTSVLLAALVSMTTHAARPDDPPGDANAITCRAALGLAPGEKRSVWIFPTTPPEALSGDGEVILSDQIEGDRRIVRKVRLSLEEWVATLRAHRGSLVVADERIETQALDRDQVEVPRASVEPEGEVDISIESADVSVQYVGDDALIEGDVFTFADQIFLVLGGRSTSRTDWKGGYVSGNVYEVLPLESRPRVGLAVIGAKPDFIHLEKGGARQNVVLLGKAEFAGRVSIADGTRYDGVVTKFEPRAPEPERLVRLTISNFRSPGR